MTTGGGLDDSMDFHESIPLTPSSSVSVFGDKPKVCSLLVTNLWNSGYTPLAR